MVRLLCLLIVFLLITTTGYGQSNTASLSEIEIEHLSATRALLKKAMLNGDIVTLKRVYSEDYELVTRSGRLISRTERIEMLESGKLKYLDVGDEADVTIKTYGNVAVVRGVVGVAETEFFGERRKSEPRRFMEIWIHKDGIWREVGRQTTAISVSAP